MHEPVVPDDGETTPLGREQPPGQGGDLAQFLLVAVPVELLDVVAIADPRGLGQVEVALAKAPLAQVETRHLDAGLPRRNRPEVRHGFPRHQAEGVVAVGLPHAMHEIRDLVGRRERNVARDVQDARFLVLDRGRVAPRRTRTREQAAVALPGVLIEVGKLLEYAERLAQPCPQLGLGEQVPEALGVANDRDARDLGHVLERQHHVGHQGQAPDLEEDLVLSAHRLRGTAVAGGHHRGDAHRTPTVGRARPGHKTLDRPSREFGARQSQTSGIWRPPEPTSGI